MERTDTIKLLGTIGVIFLLSLGIFSETVSAYPGYQTRYGISGYGSSYGYNQLSARNEYWRYQLPSSTGYVFSPGYYNGPRYFPGFTRNYGAVSYGPYGSYSSRNRVYPYQYVPRWT